MADKASKTKPAPKKKAAPAPKEKRETVAQRATRML